jgi:UDP-2-acetamido-3-amino-2,3-dideoxy-glucuronate N-acetyltransferase
VSLYIDPLAIVESDVLIDHGVKVWAHAHIRSHAKIGENSIIGSSVYVGPGVTIGDNCKIQNAAQLFEPCTLESGVFVGPGAVLTNDLNPRAVNPDFSLKSPIDWNATGVVVRHGASIGAGAICVAPIEIGTWAMIAAGAVVVKNVADFSMVAGVPAKQIGWVSKSGFRLIECDGYFQCPVSGSRYVLEDDVMRIEE